MRTSSSNHQLSGSAGGPFQHTLDSSCRLHELAVAAAAAAAAQHYPSPAVAEGLSPSSVSAANTSSAATHLRGPGIVSPNGSSSTASSQGTWSVPRRDFGSYEPNTSKFGLEVSNSTCLPYDYHK